MAAAQCHLGLFQLTNKAAVRPQCGIMAAPAARRPGLCTALPRWPRHLIAACQPLHAPDHAAACAQVLHLPAFEGRTDGRSQRTIIGHVAPRHLVIVNGTAEVGQVLGSRVHLCRIEKVC